MFADAKGQSIRNATVTKTVDENRLQLLTLTRDKFNALLASGVLNEDCINKLKHVAGQRAEANRTTKFGDVLKKAIVSRPNEQEQTPEQTQKRKHDATNDDVEKHRRLLAKTIQSVDTFRRIVLKIGMSMTSLPRERNIDGNTVVGKKIFLVLAKKIIVKMHKLTLSSTVKEELWLSACNSSKREAKTTGVELNGLPCAVLETWLGVEDTALYL